MSERDEVQVARWTAIRNRVGSRLRELRHGYSQAKLSGDLEDLGYHLTQSRISRIEQGLIEQPLSLERLTGWALCCEALSAPAFKQLLRMAGFRLPWADDDLRRFDDLLRHYRRLPIPDQIVLRRKLLWHLLGLDPKTT